tara:strand:+ start:477 stop:989 length:513 start_codon:yes stop_codon:yes gene_type:complete
MSFNVKVSNDCKILVIHGKSYVSGSSGEISITNVDTGAAIFPNPVIVFSGANNVGSVHIDIGTFPSPNGLYKICLIENSVEQVCKPILIHCDLDCCLTKLTNELLACACDCPKCSTTLAKAQKIFLLLQSALSTVSIASADSSNQGYYTDILNKYKKAVELCDSSCGCDC